MPYGSDISAGGDYREIAFSLSNPQSASSLYTLTDYAYDIAINGQPFFMQTSDQSPYRRATAQYRKEQYDQTREAGEQSLTGWWFRSQSSFHLGQGIKYFEPAQDESLRFQYTESKGLDVWTKGQATLLRESTPGHNTTGDLHTNLRPFQYMRSIRWTTSGITYDGTLVHDEYDVDKIKVNDPTNPVHFIDYNAGVNDKVYAICDDGTTAYWVTNDSVGGKLQVWKKALSLDSSSAGTLMFDKPGITVANAVFEHVKGRLVLCVNNKIYELTTSSTILPTEIYTNPEPAYSFTAITESGNAIYVSGYNGIQSTIIKFTLETDGGMPTLAFATTAAEMPAGEIIYKIYQYLGYMLIGTSRGIRLGTVGSDGNITYGKLVVETSQPCYDFAARGPYVWCATGVETSPGVIRISLGDVVDTLVPAYSFDVYHPTTTGKVTTSCAFFGDTDRLCFTTKKSGAVDGFIYSEAATNKISSGYLQTGYIRYNTLEDKIFKFISPRIDTTDGAFTVQSVGEDGSEYNIGGYAQGAQSSELGIPYPSGTHQYLGFKFTLNRSSSNSANGPLFTGYQLKALPAVLRQRLIQYPLMCYDRESDSMNNEVGYDGRAFDRLSTLEDIENFGDTIRVQDFRTGESYIGLIEEMDFRNVTSTDKRFSGFGGILLVTVRTV